MLANKKVNQPDLAYGLLLLLIAGIALFEMRKLSSGTASNMGAGYLPRALCIFLLITGIVYTIRGFLQGKRVAIPAVAWRSFSLVFAAIAFFALTLEYLGLFGATILMTFFSSLANKESRWIELIVFALFLSGITVVLFVIGLGLPLPIWPIFIGK